MADLGDLFFSLGLNDQEFNKKLDDAKKKALAMKAEIEKEQNERIKDVLQQPINEYKEQQKRLRELQKSFKRQQEGEFKEYIQSLSSQSDASKQMSSYYKELEKSSAKAYQSIEGLNTALEQMKSAYAALNEQQKQSVQGNILFNQIGNAEKAINNFNNQIKKGQFNVDGINKSYNALNIQIGMLARELPNLGISLSTFIISLTNNIPYAADAIARVNEENKLLQASGKDVVPVFKQILKAILNWQTALILGVTLMAAYSREIQIWVKGIMNGNTALKSLEKAHETINKLYVEGAKEAANEISKLELLYSVTQNQTRSIQDRTNAALQLQKIYPDYFGNLTTEAILIGKASEAYKKLSEDIIESAKSKIIEKNTTENIEDIESNLEKIKELDEKINELESKISKSIKLGGNTYALEESLDAAKKRRKELEDENNLIKDSNLLLAEYYKPQNKVALENQSPYLQLKDIEPYKKYEKALADLDKQKKMYLITQEEYNDSVNKEKGNLLKSAAAMKFNSEDLEVIRKEYIKYNKIKLSSKTIDTQKQLDDIQKAYNDLKDATIKGELEVQQARINLMEDSSEKTLAQIRLDYDKRIAEVQKYERELIEKIPKQDKDEWEKANPGKKFGFTSLSKEQQETINDKYSLAFEQMGKSYDDVLKNMLDAYKDYAAQREAIEKKLNDDIAAFNSLRTDENSKEIDRAIAQAQKQARNQISKISLKEFKESIDFSQIFGNLDSITTSAIEKLRDQLKEYISKASQSLSPEDLKDLSDAINKMDLKIAERNPFKEFAKGLEEYKNTQQAVEQAQKDLNTVTSGGEVIIGSYIDSTGKIIKKLLTQEQAEKSLTNAQRKKKEAQVQLTQSVNSIGEKGQQVVQAGNDLVDMLTNLGIKIPESVTGALSGVGQIMDGLANIDITKPMSIVTGVTGMLAGLGKTIGSIFGLGGDSNTKKYFEDLKEQLDGINKIYDKIIENSKEKITFGEGFAAVTAAADAMDTLNKKLENYRSLVRAGIEYKDGSKENAGWHSNKNVGAENFAQMSKLVGKDIASVYDLANLGAEDLYVIMTKMPGAWGAMDEHVRTALEDIIACKDEAKELGDALNEAITGVSFDSFYNGFIDQLANMDTSFEDMTDNFEEYLRKSIISGLVANSYKGQIEDLYKDWAEAGKDQIYTDKEIQELRNNKDKLFQEMLADRENLAKTFGWESSSTSQDLLKKGIQGITEQQYDVYIGYLNSVRQDVSAMRQLLIELKNKPSPVANNLALIMADVKRIEANTFRCANSNDVILKAVQSIDDRFKRVTSSGTGVKLNL